MAKPNMKRIHKVVIKRMLDESPDTSYLGEYGNRATSEFSIDRQHALDCVVNTGVDLNTPCSLCETSQSKHSDDSLACPSPEVGEDWIDGQSFEPIECSECGECRDSWNRHEYQYFNPSFNYVDKYGKALPGNTPEEIRAYVKSDYERMESLNSGQWSYIGIQAEATIQLTKTGPFQKIRSGSIWGTESDSDRDCLDSIGKEELSDLSMQLQALGFSRRAIASAFKNVTEVSE